MTAREQLWYLINGVAARFSEFEEDLKIPKMYFSKEEVLAKVKEVQSL